MKDKTITYGCQQILLHPDKDTKAILEFICSESTKLTNCALYYSRQLYFKTGKAPSKFDLCNELKSNPHFQTLFSQAAQQTLINVAESFKSFFGLLRGIKKGAVKQKPKLPNYRKGGLTLLTYPAQQIKLKDNLLRFPLGNLVNTWFNLKYFTLPMPSNLDFSSIREFRILPRNKEFYLELVYKLPKVESDVDPKNVLGLDHGINNWLTGVSNVGTSLIVDGRHVKSMNQWYNKRVSVLKENQPKNFWSKQLSRITEKRNRQMRDAVNKAARKILKHCLENKIGTVIFGWNKEQKQNINLGGKTNQSFTCTPTGRLKTRISQLGEQYGLKFLETEESYTSKASFIDQDVLPKFGEKPEGWHSSGKRVKRGLFRTSQGFLINADCNGAANILRKLNVSTMFNLNGVSRGALSAPFRVLLWNY